MLIPFDTIDGGIVRDVAPHQLPPNVWSDGQNVRFIDGHIEKIKGQTSVFGTPSGAPYWLLPVAVGSTYFWIYPSLTAVYATDGSTHSDISNGSYTADETYLWNGGVFAGVPILNNGQERPQMWGTQSLGSNLSDLDNWPAAARTRVIRPFNNFLLALHVDEDGTSFNPRLMWWSTPSTTPGTVPSSWDYADPTTRAGRTEFAETGDWLIDCLPMRDFNVVYKENSVYGQQYIGGNQVFRFYKLFEMFGALSRRCMKAFYGRHIVLTDGDIVLHDGQQANSIVDRKMRRWLFSQIDTDTYFRAFVTPNYAEKEMWVCFPSNGASYPDTALVWNWNENKFAIRDLPNTAHIGYGVIDPSATSTTFDTDSGTFDAAVGSFDEQQYNPTLRRMLAAVPGDTSLLFMDDGYQREGSNYRARVERIALPVGRMGQQGPQQDPHIRKTISAIYPELEGSGDVQFYIGKQEFFTDEIEWDGPYTYTIGSDYKIDCRVEGRIISLRVESNNSGFWRLNSFMIDRQGEGLK